MIQSDWSFWTAALNQYWINSVVRISQSNEFHRQATEHPISDKRGVNWCQTGLVNPSSSTLLPSFPHYSFTPSLTSLSHYFTHFLALTLHHFLNHLFIYSFNQSPVSIHSFTELLIHSLLYSFSYLLLHSLISSFTVTSFVTRSLLCQLNNHSFTQVFILTHFLTLQFTKILPS